MVEGPAPTTRLVVLCHGFGAPADDLVGVAGELVHLDPTLGVGTRFIFPAGPLSLDMAFGGRAWWHIDLAELQRAGSIDALLERVPEGLSAARRMLSSAVADATRQAGLRDAQVVVGGFSQGAMLATDFALHAEDPPGALLVLSGTLIARTEWTALLRKRQGLRVFQSHGRADPILPFAAAQALGEMLKASGQAHEFVPFAGGHGIDPHVLKACAAFLHTTFAESAAAQSTRPG